MLRPEGVPADDTGAADAFFYLQDFVQAIRESPECGEVIEIDTQQTAEARKSVGQKRKPADDRVPERSPQTIGYHERMLSAGISSKRPAQPEGSGTYLHDQPRGYDPQTIG